MATVYDLVPATDYADRTVQGNLDAAQSQSYNVRELTTGVYSIDDEIVVLCDASGGDIIINLPSITNAPRRFYLFKKTNLTNMVTLNATGGNTIEGAFSFDITSNITVELINSPTGNEWTIISNLGATTTPTDTGLATREFRMVNGGGQNPSVNFTVTEVSIQGPAAGSLANGVLGQLKEITIVEIPTPGDSYTLTLSNAVGQNTLVFDTVGQSLSLRYTAFGWGFTNAGAIVS